MLFRSHVSLDELYVSVEKYNSYLTLGGIVILVLCVLYILYNAFKKNNATKTK